MESILTSIKNLLLITEDYEHFDAQVITHINTVFTTLCQLGVGPKKCFSIVDKHDTWDQFLPMDDERFNSVKTYMYMKVKLMFDPPLSSAVMSSMERQLSELEFRLMTDVDARAAELEVEADV